MAKPVELRQLAADDIDAALSYYRREAGESLATRFVDARAALGSAPTAETAGESLATRFVDALETELSHLSRHPLIGSLRYSYELNIPALRSWPLKAFPYIVFYIDRAEFVDVWRVLHARRDIPTGLAPPD